MIQILIAGIINKNPIAYMLLFMLFYPPIMIIIFEIIDKIKNDDMEKR